MGYYTKYNLAVEPEYKKDEIAIWARKEHLVSSKWEIYIARIIQSGSINEKWYEHVDALVNASINFPDVIFTLYGNGEEDDDFWCKYFENGKYTKNLVGKIVYED